MPNYYEILGIEPNVSDEDIKKAYRSLAREFHPDVNKEPDAEGKMKTISQAYGILSDPEKRKQYDLSQFNKMPNFPGFENFGQRNRKDGTSFHFEIKYNNTSLQVVVPYQLKELLSQKITTINFRRRKTCPKCKNLSPCTECIQGFLYEDITKEITLPAGLNAGQFVLQGEGNQEYLDNPPGHVVIKPYVEISEECQVINGDVVVHREIDPVLLLLGGELIINSPFDEEIVLQVQANSYESNVKKVTEKGLPLIIGNGDRRGALVVILNPKFSKDLTDEQLSILKSYLESINNTGII